MTSRPKKNHVGRPSKYNPRYCEMLIDHMAKGLSFECFAGEVKTTIATIYNWVDKHPEFLEAKKHGTALSMKFWEQTGVAGMTGMIPGFNPATWIFNMKNRFRWRDRVEVRGKVKTTPVSGGDRLRKVLEDPAMADVALQIAEAMSRGKS